MVFHMSRNSHSNFIFLYIYPKKTLKNCHFAETHRENSYKLKIQVGHDQLISTVALSQYRKNA